MFERLSVFSFVDSYDLCCWFLNLFITSIELLGVAVHVLWTCGWSQLRLCEYKTDKLVVYSGSSHFWKYNKPHFAVRSINSLVLYEMSRRL